MNKQTSLWIDNHKEDMIEACRKVLRHRSVKDLESADPSKGIPFGKGIRSCLDEVLLMADSLGFETQNLDGYCGCVDYGEGEEQLGILAHLDVVPEGTGWTYPPYDAQIHDGKIWGRGALDDKGPAISALYAMAAVKASGLQTRRRIRLILGCDEESGMECLAHYHKVCASPDLCFSPDADYPLVNSEKNICGAVFHKSFSSVLTIDAGTVRNAVAYHAVCKLPLEEEEIRSCVDLSSFSPFEISVEPEESGGSLISIQGVGAHASTPWMGHNAIYAMFDLLSRLPLPEDDLTVLRELHQLFRYESHGQSLGIDQEDESGRLTANCGILHWDKDGIQELALDIRAPISTKENEMFATLENSMKKAGLLLLSRSWDQGYHIPEDHELVVKLLEVYRRYFSGEAKPLAIGGGTYARHMKNAVAFGPERPGFVTSIHMPDENIPVEHLIENAKIYADAIIALACKEGAL